MLRAEPALRRVVTDASVEGAAKAGLAGNVFAGKVADPALDAGQGGRPAALDRSRDLAAVLEQLGDPALVRSAGAQGRRVSDELFAVGQLIDANPDLRDALSDPARSDDDKAALLGTVLDGKVLPATLRLVAQAVRGDESFGRSLETIQPSPPTSRTSCSRSCARPGRSAPPRAPADPGARQGLRRDRPPERRRGPGPDRRHARRDR